MKKSVIFAEYLLNIQASENKLQNNTVQLSMTTAITLIIAYHAQLL